MKKVLDELLTKKKYKLKLEKENIILTFNIPILFEEVKTKIFLNKINLDVDNSLYEEINNMKNKLGLNEKVISELKEKNSILEEKIEKLQEKMNDMENIKKSMIIFEKMKDFNEKEEKEKKKLKKN